MSASELAAVQNQVQKFWAPMFMGELLETAPLPALVNKDYQGDLKRQGDTVRVSQINRPAAQIKDQSDSTFASSLMSTSYVDIVADKRITAAFELSDLIDIQSQLGNEQSAIRQTLVESAMIELNKYLYGLVAPSTSSPDHSIASVSDFNAAQLLACRALAAQAKWRKEGGWWALLSPSYMNDVLTAATLTSQDYVGDRPVVAGQVASQRFGFNILEDNSEGALLMSPAAAGTDVGLLFHPDFMHLVIQREPTFQVSSLHSNKQHGYLVSVDMIVGAKLGVDGNLKHIKVYNS